MRPFSVHVDGDPEGSARLVLDVSADLTHVLLSNIQTQMLERVPIERCRVVRAYFDSFEMNWGTEFMRGQETPQREH